MKNYRKWISLFLTVAMAMSLSACGSTGQSQAVNTDSLIADASAETTELEGEAHEDYTWDEICEMNEGERMISMFEGDGEYLTFLGNKYCDDIIHNEDEALDSLQYISSLLGLEDVNLIYYRTDTSTVTGNIYYTFVQAGEGEVNGEKIYARFYNSLVKVITDQDGNVLGVSSNLTHDPELKYTYDDFVTADYANERVQKDIGDERQVYTEQTELIYWDDDGSVSDGMQGKEQPAYLVYCDAPSDQEKNPLNKPIEVDVISAEKTLDKNHPVNYLATYYADSLNDKSMDGEYTSKQFFENLEDAGEYSYEVSLDWVKEAYEDYSGDMTRTVTVPVMQDKDTGLYYLGSKEKFITCTNFYDFDVNDEVNPYVTEDPESLDGWHFLSMSDEEDGIEKYFNDPDYVLSSFEVYVDVIGEYHNTFGLDSVDETNMPLLLGVYATEEGEPYPDEIDGFEYNASNYGQILDWEVIVTSPVLAECLNHSVMGHEFTHGVNSQLTKSQYLNAPGAIMESYADIIGTQLAMVNGYHDDIADWQLAGIYDTQMRSMSEPNDFNQPKYIDGVYYMNPIQENIQYYADFGGVHQNSGVLNYLAYSMVNGTEEGTDSEVLSIEENLNLWFETLYMTTYISDYYDVGQYLLFAAKCQELPEEQQDYISSLMQERSIIPDENNQYHEEIEEDEKEISFHLDTVEEDYADEYDLAIWLDYNDGEREMFGAGDVVPGETTTIKVKSDDEVIPRFTVTDVESGKDFGLVYITEEPQDEYDIVLEEIQCDQGDTFRVPGNKESIYYSSLDNVSDYLSLDDDGSILFEVANEGATLLSVYDEEEENYRLICFFA